MIYPPLPGLALLAYQFGSISKSEFEWCVKKWNEKHAMEDKTTDLEKGMGWNVLTEDAEGVIHGLPGDDGKYLMTDGKDIWIDAYVDGVDDGIFLDSGRDIREIKAWMYMPELPKTEGRVKW